MNEEVRGTTWSDREIDLIVTDYFNMLTSELARRPYVKAEHNRALRDLTGRAPGSIERKHQNISAVLVKLGRPWIVGYKPLSNFQNALIDGIERFLAAEGEATLDVAAAPVQVVADPASLWIGPPPRRAAEPPDPPALRRLIRKYDPAERDAKNRKLGKEGEGLIFEHEQRILFAAGRDDLAKRVEWTSEVRGDGAGYDIRSFDADGRERLIEVKTTNGAAITPFFLSENERAFSEERADAFRLLRLYGFATQPAAFELRAPLADHLRLSATNYRATF
ncbi:MAG TPA: DUF3883 domain-containing protein [Allosphingosinicella sp.]|nr:DUF3883 domain-containing protein [Allosphingosinicella sp.]